MPTRSEDDLLDSALENPQIAPFAMFNIELPCGGDLWSIRSNEDDAATQKREDMRIAAIAHQERVQAMTNRVELGLPALATTDEVDDTPEDEWRHFWCGASPTQRGWV